MEQGTSNIRKLIVLGLIALLLPMAWAAPKSGGDDPKAANKTHAAAADVEYLSSDFEDTDLGVAILQTTIKSSKPTDLLLQVSMECALWTEVTSTTIADHPNGYKPYSRAEARVEIWIEIDGVQVDLGPVDGRVTFCDRVQEQEITDIDDDTGNFTIRQFQATKTANAFNWFTFDVGSGTHEIVVKADIEADSTAGAYAEGAIGARSLIVEPTRFANGAGY